MRSKRKNAKFMMLRGYLARFLSVLIVICYLLQPLQGPIKMAMHSISHLVAKPEQVITHSMTINTHSANYHDHHEHQLYKVNHQHVIMEFLEVLLEGKTGDSTNDQSLVEIIKIEKHLVYHKIALNHILHNTPKDLFPFPSNHIKEGFLQDLLRPPALG